MKGICPNCEKETELKYVKRTETVEVRGEPVEVKAEFFVCAECGAEFENTRSPDALARAYYEYRRRHDMLQPEEIRQLRKRYGLTQKELSRLLGWGAVTLSRYENGALQDEAHEKILRLASEPHNLITLIEETPDALPEDKRERLISELRTEEENAYSFQRFLEERFGDYSPDEFSGFRKLDIQKMFGAILFFCLDGELKTKLNKLLFYADFKHFKENALSITGARYIHLQYGPVPDNYEYFFAELGRERLLRIEEESYDGYTGFKCMASAKPDLALFSKSEVEILDQVKKHFKDFGSVRIMTFSHEETAYSSTREGEAISYQHASTLKI